MKTSELLETSDTDLYAKAIERMFANLGMPGILNLRHRFFGRKVKFLDSNLSVRYSNMQADAKSMMEAFMSDGVLAVIYARAQGAPWPPGENAIAASNADTAFIYARDVIKGPWPPGEKVIATNGWASYEYARNIIKNPWPPGEKAIAADTTGWARGFTAPAVRQAETAWRGYVYARDVLKGRFPAAEPTIAADDTAAGMYARDIIKGPWPEAGIK